MMEVFLQIGERAITSGGAVSADWVMVGITFIAFFLFWRMLNKIEKGMEKVIESVASHETDIELLKKSDSQHEKDIAYLHGKIG